MLADAYMGRSPIDKFDVGVLIGLAGLDLAQRDLVPTRHVIMALPISARSLSERMTDGSHGARGFLQASA